MGAGAFADGTGGHVIARGPPTARREEAELNAETGGVELGMFAAYSATLDMGEHSGARCKRS
jgi:hypothetical protein